MVTGNFTSCPGAGREIIYVLYFVHCISRNMNELRDNNSSISSNSSSSSSVVVIVVVVVVVVIVIVVVVVVVISKIKYFVAEGYQN